MHIGCWHSLVTSRLAVLSPAAKKETYWSTNGVTTQIFTAGKRIGSHRSARSEMPSIDQLIVWIIVGLLGGSIAGLLVKRDRKGFGAARNLGIGLIGAVIGGFLFRLFGLFPGLDKVAISLRDVVAAVVGSLLVLAALWLWQRWKGPS